MVAEFSSKLGYPYLLFINFVKSATF